MGKGRLLLLVGKAVEEVKERDGVFGSLFLRLFRCAVVADLLTLDDHGSAVRRFREGQHVVVGESDALADFKGNAFLFRLRNTA